MNVSVFSGKIIPYIPKVTAWPFAIGTQTPETGSRALAWDDFFLKPSIIFPVIVLPIVAVMLVYKGVMK